MNDLRIQPERLRLLRESLNLSQDDLARRALISQAYVTKLEKQNPQRVSYGVVHRLARVLGVEMNYLLVEPIEGAPPLAADNPLLGHAISQAMGLDEAKQERLARMLLPIVNDLLKCDCPARA